MGLVSWLKRIVQIKYVRKNICALVIGGCVCKNFFVLFC
jgi:hypothetical protein